MVYFLFLKMKRIFPFVLSHKRTFFLVVLLPILLALLFGLFAGSSVQQTEGFVVESGVLSDSLTLSGSVAADEHVKLGFPAGGKLAWVGVKKGDYVFPYQTIATLDSRTTQKNLQNALLDYSKQRNTFDQKQEDNLNRKPYQALNDAMKRILENNQYDLEKAVVSVELEDLAKEQSVLTTPIGGLVVAANPAFAGVFLSATSPGLYEIVNPDSIYFEVSADQTEVIQLSVDRVGTIVFDSYPDEDVQGTITSVDFIPKTDETGTVYGVKVTLSADNSAYRYRIGMTGDITFTLREKRNTLFVPTNFVKTDETGKFVLKGREKKKTPVKTGMETETDVEIQSGLKEGDTVYD